MNRSPHEPASSPASRDRGPLRPIELATAAVLGAMTVVFVLVGSFVPHASGVAALGAVPMGVIAERHRPRAVLAGVVASISVSFIIAGTGVVSTITLCGCIGGLAGHARRKHWSPWGLLGASAVLGPLLAGASDGLLWAFAALRKLTFRQLLNTTRGLAAVVGRTLDVLVGWVPGWSHVGARVTRHLDLALAFGFRNWWGLIALVVTSFTVGATVTTWLLLRPIVEQLDQVTVTDRLAPATAAATASAATASAATASAVTAPVPVRLVDVTVRYPGAAADALDGVSLSIEAQQLTVVLGPNGSGKSTLARVLAGCPPTSGQVLRSGAPGLGQAGGTAVIAQRPESQVLGVRVIDDLLWGLARHADVDVPGLLGAVGLAGMATRYTAGLSGGELQRLAVAAALARRPQLLVSDESTAMVDAEGRRTLVALLGRLPAERAMSVVHVTHRLVEAAGADQVLRLGRGRVVTGDQPGADSDPAGGPDHVTASAATVESRHAVVPGVAVETDRRPAGGAAPTAPTLRLVDVGHVYAGGTPWETTALRHVTLEIGGGSGVLVLGGNGSGKSTLAWVLAGLLRPTSGRCEFDGRAVHEQVGTVGLAFQHARLQVQGPTVGREVRAAGNVERAEAEAALGLVGLDAGELWGRSVDELSGGQLRRVALAGLLARAPKALVLDEPLAGLDDASRAGLAGVLSELRAREGVTLIVITHELAGLDQVCDRVVRLERGCVVADQPFLSPDPDPDADADASSRSRDPGAPGVGLAPSASRAER